MRPATANAHQMHPKGPRPSVWREHPQRSGPKHPVRSGSATRTPSASGELQHVAETCPPRRDCTDHGSRCGDLPTAKGLHRSRIRIRPISPHTPLDGATQIGFDGKRSGETDQRDRFDRRGRTPGAIRMRPGTRPTATSTPRLAGRLDRRCSTRRALLIARAIAAQLAASPRWGVAARWAMSMLSRSGPADDVRCATPGRAPRPA